MARNIASRTYKIRRFQNGKNRQNEPHYNYSLTVPTATAQRIPRHIEYACEVIPEITLPEDDSIPEDYRGVTLKGILFRPLDELPPPPPELPPWTKKSQQQENGKPEPRPARQRRRPGHKTPS